MDTEQLWIVNTFMDELTQLLIGHNSHRGSTAIVNVLDELNYR